MSIKLWKIEIFSRKFFWLVFYKFLAKIWNFLSCRNFCAKLWPLEKKKCQKKPFLPGGPGIGENRQTYDNNDEKFWERKVFHVLPRPKIFFHVAEISAQNYDPLIEKKGKKNAFFQRPSGIGENRQTYGRKSKKKFLVKFWCVLPVPEKNFVLQKFLRQNMHAWKLKSPLFCLKNGTFSW